MWNFVCGSLERVRLKKGFWKAAPGVAAGIALIFAMVAGCRGSAMVDETKPAMELTSSAIRDGMIMKKFTCDGEDTSPALAWSAAPEATQSFALTVVDPDAPRGSFVHWVLYEMPAATRELPEGVPKQDELPDGSRQGRNDFGRTGYGGPCPPSGPPHRYVFALYALDSKLNLAAGATRGQVESALKAHVLARGELIGRYHR